MHFQVIQTRISLAVETTPCQPFRKRFVNALTRYTRARKYVNYYFRILMDSAVRECVHRKAKRKRERRHDIDDNIDFDDVIRILPLANMRRCSTPPDASTSSSSSSSSSGSSTASDEEMEDYQESSSNPPCTVSSPSHDRDHQEIRSVPVTTLIGRPRRAHNLVFDKLLTRIDNVISDNCTAQPSSTLYALPLELWADIFELLATTDIGVRTLASFASTCEFALYQVVRLLPRMPVRHINLLPTTLFHLALARRRMFAMKVSSALMAIQATPTLRLRSIISDYFSARKLQVMLKSESVSIEIKRPIAARILHDYTSSRQLSDHCELTLLLPAAIRLCNDPQEIKRVTAAVVDVHSNPSKSSLAHHEVEVLLALAGNPVCPTASIDTLACCLFRDGHHDAVLRICENRCPSSTTISALLQSALSNGRLDFCQTLVSTLPSLASCRIAKTVLLATFVDCYAALGQYSKAALNYIYSWPPANYQMYTTEFALILAIKLCDSFLVRRIFDSVKSEITTSSLNRIEFIAKRAGMCVQ
jgi:hypothetical protein